MITRMRGIPRDEASHIHFTGRHESRKFLSNDVDAY
jgi:hypothetical protein